MVTSVLVTSAGTASAVSIIKALCRQREREVRVIAVDSDDTAPGLFLASARATVPRCGDDRYVPRLVELCRDHGVRVVFPTFSREIELIARSRRAFEDVGVTVLLPAPEVVALCDDKRAMYRRATALGLVVPGLPGEPPRFPLFAKPNFDSGASHSMKVDDATDLAWVLRKHPDFLLQEWVAGRELTVDLLCDRSSELVVASPRIRLSVKAGQSVKGVTVESPGIVELCRRLCREIGYVGAGNAQFIESAGRGPVFLELNPRFAAGGLMLTVEAGANLPLLALALALGERPTAPRVRPGVTMIRYWEEIFSEDHRGS